MESVRNESRHLSVCRHANVVKLIDYGDYDMTFLTGQSAPVPYVVVEHAGLDLHEYMLVRSLCWRERISVLRQIAAALAACHEQGVAHQDLSPDNVLVDSTPSGLVAKICDFGCAISFDEWGRILPATGLTNGYRPPSGEPQGPTVDAWGFGVLVHKMSFERPFIEDRLVRRLPSPSEVVPYHLRARLIQLVEDATAADPCTRPALADVCRRLEDMI